jgi:hypothetical protein
VPQRLAVPPAVPSKNLRALIELAQARPDDIRCGSRATGAHYLHAPHKGAGIGIGMPDLIGVRELPLRMIHPARTATLTD